MKKRQQQATATLHINDLGGSWDSAGTFGGYASEAQEDMAEIMQTMHNLSQEVKDLKEQKEKDQKEQAEKEKNSKAAQTEDQLDKFLYAKVMTDYFLPAVLLSPEDKARLEEKRKVKSQEFYKKRLADLKAKSKAAKGVQKDLEKAIGADKKLVEELNLAYA